MDLLTRSQLSRAAELLAAATRARVREAAPRVRLARLLDDLARGHVHGADREALQEFAHQAGVPFDPHRPSIPFAALAQRDLAAGDAAAGGYLVSAETAAALDLLRPWSVTARAGIEVVTGLVGDQVVPRVAATSTPYWLSTEASAPSASQPTLAQAVLRPKTVGGLIQLSRQLALQTSAEAFVRRELLRTLGTAIDQAVLAGTGASGQPTGIVNTAGIGTQSGTGLSHSGVCAMAEAVAAAHAPDAQIAFLATPAVRRLLQTRERAAGSGFVWDRDQVASRPAYASTDVPSATLLCGAWPLILLGVWGPGVVVEVNPYEATGFRAGIIQARLLVSCDVAVRHPAAFCVATSVT